jgi:hypothetical protein
MGKMQKVKIRDLKGSEIDRMDNLAVAVEALIEEETKFLNESGAITSGVNLNAAQATIKALRRLFYEG